MPTSEGQGNELQLGVQVRAVVRQRAGGDRTGLTNQRILRRQGRQDMNQTHTIAFTGTRIGWAEASPDSDLLPGIIVTTNRRVPDQPERFPDSLLGHDARGAPIYQIDADEGQLREAMELVPAGGEAEFRVRIQGDGRLRLERIIPTSPS